MDNTFSVNEKSSRVTKNLFDVYPKPTTSEEESSVFFRKVFGAAVSHLTYLRGIFPEYLYGSRSVQDMDLKIIHGTKIYPLAHDFIRQIDGIFHAFQRKYLEQAILGFHTVHDATVPIEAYIFKFGYSGTQKKRLSLPLLKNSKIGQGTYGPTKCSINEGPPLSSNPNPIEEATVQLFKQIILITKAMGPLPKKVVIRWKLLYFDSMTPKDYEPPGFKRTSSMCFPVIRGNHLGQIVSPFHRVWCDNMRIENEKDLLESKSAESAFVTDDSWTTAF